MHAVKVGLPLVCTYKCFGGLEATAARGTASITINVDVLSLFRYSNSSLRTMPDEISLYAFQHDIVGAYYIPEFISREEEVHLLRKIGESPKHRWKTLCNRRLQLWGGQVLQNTLLKEQMPAFLTSFPDILSRLRGTRAFERSPHREPNHIILNEYLPGQGIMPHEDGLSYYPVVATISLGSHTIFHYFRYNPGGEVMMDSTISQQDGKGNGRSIDAKPVLSVLLEPRSAIITTDDLYTSHLHGIDETLPDTFVGRGWLRRAAGEDVLIANWQNIGDENMHEVVRHGGTLTRAMRYSLTCRDVEKVKEAFVVN